MIRNIAYITAGTAGVIFGITLLDEGAYMAIGGGCVIIICGAYIAYSGIKNIISDRKNDKNEKPQNSGPVYSKKRKKKKNSRKK